MSHIPGSVYKGRQLRAVFDINKCLECHSCTMGHKQLWTKHSGREYMYWNNVESMPGWGYPKGWGSRYNNTADGSGEVLGGGFADVVLDPDKHDGTALYRGPVLRDGKQPTLEHHYGIPWEYNWEVLFEPGPTQRAAGAKILTTMWKGKEVKPTWGPNWDEDQGAGQFPNAWWFPLARICNHCTHPACLSACPRKAIYKRQQDGIVLIDQNRCRGYRHCVKACPYKKIYFNFKTGKSEKCILCYPRVEKGVPPMCFWQCVGRIRWLSFVDDTKSNVHKLIYDWKVALPLRPDFGTEPNVFYIPPLAPYLFGGSGELLDESSPLKMRRVPVKYLAQMFAGGNDRFVENALDTLEREREKVRKGGNSELMKILISQDTEDRFQLNVNGRPFWRSEEVQPVEDSWKTPSQSGHVPHITSVDTAGNVHDESFYQSEYARLIKEFPKMESPEDDSSARKGVAVAEPRQPGMPMPGHGNEPVQTARLADDELFKKLHEEHGMEA